MGDDAWDVLIPPDLASEISSAIAEIESRLVPEDDPRWKEQLTAVVIPEEHGPELARGRAGRELFRWYVAVARSVDQERARSDLLKTLSHIVANHSLGPGFYQGIAGLMWMYAHVLRFGRGDNTGGDGVVFREFDAALEGTLRKWNSGLYDIVLGLCGFGAYALERLPDNAAAQTLDLIVMRLSSLALWDRRGAWWTTPRSWIHERFRSEYPEGWCDLGMAHGIGGPIAFLAEVLEFSPSHREAANLLEGAGNFVVAVAKEFGGGTDLPSALAVRDGTLTSRRGPGRVPGWCYGSLGIACALSRAARVTGNQTWMAASLEMARAQSMRLSEMDLTQQDTGLCHGIAGVAHMLNKLYQRTGEPGLRTAAIRCYRHLLDSRVAEEVMGPTAGFRTLLQYDERPAEWVRSFALLYGIAGIGLSLLAANQPVAPAWDRLLLI